MNGIRTIDVHNNIFGCNSNCGVERVYYEANKTVEAAKESNLYDNYFFGNRRDLELASSGAATISVPAARIEEAEQIGPKYEGNKELPAGNDAFLNAIDQPYLQGFMNLEIVKSQSYDANSTINQMDGIPTSAAWISSRPTAATIIKCSTARPAIPSASRSEAPGRALSRTNWSIFCTFVPQNN